MATKINCNNLYCLNNNNSYCCLNELSISTKGKCKDITPSQRKCLTCEHNIHYTYTEDDGSIWEADECKMFVIFKSICNIYSPIGGLDETDIKQ